MHSNNRFAELDKFMAWLFGILAVGMIIMAFNIPLHAGGGVVVATPPVVVIPVPHDDKCKRCPRCKDR